MFSMKQRRAEESCTAHLFPETLPHLRTGRLMHSIDMDTSRGGRQLAAALRLACLVSWIPESCRATSVPWILTLCHKVPPPADLPRLLFTIRNSYATGQGHRTCLLSAQSRGGRGGGWWLGLWQSCPSLGNVGEWKSSRGGDGAKEGPGWLVAVRSAAVVDPEALGDLLAAQWAGAQWLAALLAAADMAAGEEDHLGLTFQAHNTL